MGDRWSKWRTVAFKPGLVDGINPNIGVLLTWVQTREDCRDDDSVLTG